MKEKILISFLLLSVLSTYGQTNNTRIIKETPTNGHSIAKINGFYCVDDETKPFTGKYIELGFENELKAESNYKAGKLNGVFLKYGKSDSVYVKSKAFYVNDVMTGKYYEYWFPNHKKKECSYNQKGELHGTWITYLSPKNEEPEIKGKYFNGVKDSTWTWYFQEKKPRTLQNFKLGKREGYSVEYYENGNKKFECMYSNDKKTGIEKDWYENGSLKHSAEYLNGKLNGKEIFYFEDGKIKSEGNFLNDNKKGKFIWYKNDGTIKEETEF